MLRRSLVLTVAAAALAVGASTLHAQRGQRGMPAPQEAPLADAKYDGRFTFARLVYTGGPGSGYYGPPSWAHGYAHAETNLMAILDAVSDINGHLDSSKMISVGDPDLGRYPVSYMAEAGYLTLNNDEATSLGTYLKKGGFIIVDDFREDRRNPAGWSNFAGVMERVWPGAQWIPLDGKHPIFHSFYDIDYPERFITAYDQVTPQYYGLFEGNDPKKRMVMMVNFMNDISQYWEFSQRGMNPLGTNEAYKLGVNYIIYGMTH